jgi:septum formation protein
MGLTFKQVPSNFEEYFDDSRPVEDVVIELGLGKALDVAKNFPEDIVIGSDLIVVFNGKQIGKPESEKEAIERLKELSGQKHQLICSVAVVCKSKNYQKTAIDIATVEFDRLSDEFIKEYVATGTTFDKAGGYAIQHPMMKPHIKSIEGRIDTIIGMPTNLVADMLNVLGTNAKRLNLDKLSKKSEQILFE